MIVPELDREITVNDRLRQGVRAALASSPSERHQLEIDKAAIGRELRGADVQVLSENDGSDPTRRAEIAARIQGIPDQIEEMDRRGAELEGEIESLRVKIDRAVQSAVGIPLPRGERVEPLRTPAQGLRLRLHEPRLQLPALPVELLLPVPRRVHAARHLGERRVDRLEAVPKLGFVRP